MWGGVSRWSIVKTPYPWFLAAVMALKRLATAGSATTPIFRLAFRKRPHCLFTGRPIKSDGVHYHQFSVLSTADQSASNVGSIDPRLLNSRLEDHQGFQKWHNGGGSFHKSACVASTAVIEIGAIVHPKAVIGANAHICSGAIVGSAVTIGQSTKLGYNVALCNCEIGDYCIIHNGVCIGQDGFVFFLDEHGDMVKKPQASLESTNRAPCGDRCKYMH